MVMSADLPDNTDEGWLTTKEAARHLGFAVQTLYNKVQNNPTFPAHKAGGGRTLRFKKAELDAWVRGQMDPAEELEPAGAGS